MTMTSEGCKYYRDYWRAVSMTMTTEGYKCNQQLHYDLPQNLRGCLSQNLQLVQ